MKILFIITTFFTINLITAIDIECTYRVNPVHGYGCDVKFIEKSSEDDCFVVNVEGKHSPGKSDDDVKYLNITSPTLELFPRRIQKKFKNIQKLYIDCEKINQLSQEDLKPFGDNLKFLSLPKSSLVFIHENLFEANTEITYLYIKSAKIENVHHKAFDPLSNKLKTFGVNFPCIGDEFEQNNEDAKELIEKLKTACFHPNYKPNKKPRECKDYDSSHYFFWAGGVIILIAVIAIAIGLFKCSEKVF